MKTPDITTRVLTEVIREKQKYGELPLRFILTPLDYDCLCNDPSFKMFGKFEDNLVWYSKVPVMLNQAVKKSFAVTCFDEILEI